MRLLLPCLALLACDAGSDTGDTGGDTYDRPDTDDTGDTQVDTSETGETGEDTPEPPELEWSIGTTGLRMELTYDGTVGSEDVVRVGIWTDEYRAGSQLEKVDTSASFPKTLEVELPELGEAPFQYEVYIAAYIDRNNDHYHYPGPEDLVLVYGEDGITSWPILIKDGYLTTGVVLAFEDPY